MRGFVWVVAFVLASGSAAAREWNAYAPCDRAEFSTEEREDLAHRRLCSTDEFNALRERFGAPTLREAAGRRGQAVRVFVLDDYHRPVAVVEVVREPELNPIATVRGLGDGERRAPNSMEAELPLFVWREIASGARAQRSARGVAAVPPPPPDAEEMTICIHGWTVIVETYGFGEPRVIQRNACDDHDEAAFSFGWGLGALAYPYFDGCERIDPEIHRGVFRRLAWCLAFSGEVDEAVRAENAASAFQESNFSSARLAYVMADDFVFVVEGEIERRGVEGLERWRSLLATGDYQVGFDTGVGHSDGVELQYLLFDNSWDEERSVRFAEIVQTWRRGDDGFWLLTSMRVAPFEVLRLSD